MPVFFLDLGKHFVFHSHGVIITCIIPVYIKFVQTLLFHNPRPTSSARLFAKLMTIYQSVFHAAKPSFSMDNYAIDFLS